MNTVQLLGRFAKDPEVREAGEHLIGSFALAVQRTEKLADFIQCQTFDDLTEIVEKYCKKGDLVAVCGSLRTDNWEDETGDRHWRTYINVSRVDFCRSAGKGDDKEDDKDSKRKEDDKDSKRKEATKKYRRKY